MIISPCISICKTDPKTGYCYGCGRNNDEKKIWKTMKTSDKWKVENLTAIKKRLSLSFCLDNSIAGIIAPNKFPR